MISPKFKWEYLLLAFSVIGASIFYFSFEQDKLAEIILLVGLLLIMILRNKSDLVDYFPVIIVIILILFPLIQIWNTPKPSINIAIDRVIFGPPFENVLFAGILKMGNNEYILSESKYRNIPFTIHKSNSSLPNESFQFNSYYVQIFNSGKVHLNNVEVKLKTPFKILEEDIIHQDIRIEEIKSVKGMFQSGEIIIKIDNLGVNNKTSFEFRNKNFGNILIESCLMSNKPIECTNMTYNSFITEVPQNREIPINNRSVLIPKFPYDCWWFYVNGNWSCPRNIEKLPEGLAPTSCFPPNTI